MKKRIIAILLIVAMIATVFSGCGSKPADDVKYFGDDLTKDTLRICVDVDLDYLEITSDGQIYRSQIYKDFIQQIKRATGLEEVTLEIVPIEEAERESALQRIRVEIMSGGGPDVFIANVSSIDSKRGGLFNFPEKNMENGLFLPLDTYMENDTQFTDWSKQTQVILEAGRNSEGQQIIPLCYTFPLVTYPKDAFDVELSPEWTTRALLDQPETEKLGAAMHSVGEYSTSMQDFGRFADYESEELLFTEEELYESVSLRCSLYDTADPLELGCSTTNVQQLIYGFFYNEFGADTAFLPYYSTDGGVTASITAYAAVNRNTRFPKEAYTAIDILMQEKMQSESEFYSWLLSGWGSIPLQHDLGTQEKPLGYDRFYLEPAQFEDLQTIKEQINAVNFRCELDVHLQSFLGACYDDYYRDGEISRETVAEGYKNMQRMMAE